MEFPGFELIILLKFTTYAGNSLVLTSNIVSSLFHLILFWVFSKQVMLFQQMKVVYIGLLETDRAKEWVVTKKTGNKLKAEPTVSTFSKPKIKI